jgi:hypothetical protein
MTISKPDLGYIAYIDESGDIGLRTVIPLDAKGASEWLIISAVVIRAENETHVAKWLRAMREEAKSIQSEDLHFKTLSDRQRQIICGSLAECDVRLFVVISNKQNMRGHRNERAEKRGRSKHYLYWWLCRLLLERVTEFCEGKNRSANTPGRQLRVELSRRADLNYRYFSNYLAKLWIQDGTEGLFLNKSNPRWSVFDPKEVYAYDHRSRAGLQLADVVASAFYRAVNRDAETSPTADFAKLLKPRIWAGRSGKHFDTGIKVLPFPLRIAHLDDEQKEVFRAYGYPEDKL